MNKKIATVGLLAAIALSPAVPEASAQQRPTPQPAKSRADAPQPAPAAEPILAASLKGGDVIARVGDSDVTADEVRAAMSLLEPRQLASLARDPALLSQTVRAILANRLALKEALAKKWEQSATVQTQLERLRETVIVESFIKSVTAPPDSYPNEAEIKAVYDSNASALVVPRRYRLAQIVISVAKDADKDAEEAARRKLNDAVKKLKAPGADFGKLSKSLSDDSATADRDGDLGWVSEPELRPEIRGQVTGLSKEAVSEPVRLDDGWHILKLLDTEASRTRSLTEVRDALAQRMRAERAEANRRAYIAELLKQTPPVINEIALSKLFEGNAEAKR
jgi:peptidylprolyl isomerase